jgi:general secretion pathway protein D
MKMLQTHVIVTILALTFLLGCATGRDVRLADRFAAEGNWEGAMFLYQEMSKKDPKNLKIREKLNEAKTQAARQYYKKGRELLEARKIPEALDAFKRALSLDPSKQEHQAGLNEALRFKDAEDLYEAALRLMRAERFSEAQEMLEKALELDPALVAAQEAIKELNEKQLLARGTETELTLKSTQPITLKFQNAKLNEVFEFLSKTSGINILFDKDVRPDSVTVTIFVKNVSFKEALNLIMTTNNLFMKKISDDTILIIPKTKQKVDQYQDLVIRTFYLSNTKADDMVNLLRTMLETRRVFVNKELNAVIMRDTPEKIKLAEKILEANDRIVAEVMFEVEALEIAESDQLKYGWNFSSNQIVISPGVSGADQPQQVISLETLRSNNYTYFFTIPSVIIDFLKTEGQAKVMMNPRLRVLDNKQAKINLGDKVPILLSSTTTAAASVGQVPTTSTATNVEFKDVGIKLTLKPKVDLGNTVTLEVNLEIATLGEQVDLGFGVKQFRFGNRTAETVLNVKNGETVVIAGLIRDDERRQVNKVPGLGDIPFLGQFFRDTGKTTEKNDFVLTIKPTVVRGLQTPDKDIQYFWSGTEDTYSTKPLFSDLPTTGDVQGDQEPGITPSEEGAPPPVPLPPSITPPPATPFVPPIIIPPAPLPAVPGIPTPSTLRRRSQIDSGSKEQNRVTEVGPGLWVKLGKS